MKQIKMNEKIRQIFRYKLFAYSNAIQVYKMIKFVYIGTFRNLIQTYAYIIYLLN